MLQMVANYGKVTDEFYGRYGGDHANRDEIKTAEGTFDVGTFPRPIVLHLVEYFFKYLFHFIIAVMALHKWFQDVRLVSASLWVQDRATLRQYANNSNDGFDEEEIINEPSLLDANCLELTDEEAVQLGEMDLSKSLEYGAGSKLVKEGLLEDAPSVTETDDGADLMEENVQEGRHGFSCLASLIVAALESDMAKNLALLFVRFVLLLWRSEGRIRILGRTLRSRAANCSLRTKVYLQHSRKVSEGTTDKKCTDADMPTESVLTESLSDDSLDRLMYSSTTQQRREEPCGRRIRAATRVSVV